MREKNEITHLNTFEMLRRVCGLPHGTKLAHIQYSNSLDREKFDYRIIRESTHDGTLAFEYMLIAEVLKNLINKKSYCKTDYTDDVVDVSYVVGDMTLTSKYSGDKVHQTLSIPVRCNYVREELKI